MRYQLLTDKPKDEMLDIVNDLINKGSQLKRKLNSTKGISLCLIGTPEMVFWQTDIQAGIGMLFKHHQSIREKLKWHELRFFKLLADKKEKESVLQHNKDLLQEQINILLSIFDTLHVMDVKKDKTIVVPEAEPTASYKDIDVYCDPKGNIINIEHKGLPIRSSKIRAKDKKVIKALVEQNGAICNFADLAYILKGESYDEFHSSNEEVTRSISRIKNNTDIEVKNSRSVGYYLI